MGNFAYHPNTMSNESLSGLLLGVILDNELLTFHVHGSTSLCRRDE